MRERNGHSDEFRDGGDGIVYCTECGFPAEDSHDGLLRMHDHLSDTHGIEGVRLATKYVREDEPASVEWVV